MTREVAKRKKPESKLSAAAKKAGAYFNAVERAKGVELVRVGEMLTRAQTKERWTLHVRAPDGALGEPFELEGHVVWIAARLAFDAKTIARTYLAQQGVAFELADSFVAKPFHANGFTPPRAILVSRDQDVTEERFDFEALRREADDAKDG